MKILARQGLEMPALGFGTWPLKGDECISAVRTALEVGYRHLDTAQAYKNESEIGVAIKASGIKRADLFVTTKIWPTNASFQRVIKSTDLSLRNLDTDYIDLLLLHWPSTEIP